MRTKISTHHVQTAAENLAGVLEHAIGHSADRAALVVWDAESELSTALADAYRLCLPAATFVQFEKTEVEGVKAEFEKLNSEDLVVLIQSTRFRLHAFRIRLELFKRSIKVIEHPHLARMGGVEALTYFDSLAYDPDYFRGVGHALKKRMDGAQSAVVDSGEGKLLNFPAGLEPAKLNIGDYTDMQNVGGQFPIGEVFTESKDLEAVHGQVRISFFGDTQFTVNRPEIPITLIVEKGRVTRTLDSTPEFDLVLANIRADDGEVWLRELGFGMNRAFTQQKTVRDIGTFERMCGVHLSLGSKHTTYNKANIRKKSARHHVDVFVLTQSVELDGERIFECGAWRV
jgi:hypothetical protein